MRAIRQGLPPRVQPYLNIAPATHELSFAAAEDFDKQALEIPSSFVSAVLRNDLILANTMFLPTAASGEIRNAVSLEVERVMPLLSSEILVTHQLNRRLDGGVEVSYFAIRRQTAEALFNWATRSGLVIQSVFLDLGGKRVEMPFSSLKRRKALLYSAATACVVSLLYLLALLPDLYLARLETAITQTGNEIADLRRNTAKIAVLQRQVRSLRSLSDAIHDEKSQAQLLEMLVQLTEASPDTVAFDSLRLDGRRIFVRGNAHHPEEWVLQIQQNPVFANVELASVIGGDTTTARQFEVRLDIIWPSERESISE